MANATAQSGKEALRVVIPEDLKAAVRKEAIDRKCWPADIVEEALKAHLRNRDARARSSSR